MNTFSPGLTALVSSLDQYDWFCDAELDRFGNFVVYVDKMDFEVTRHVPMKIDGHHVLFHFAVSQPKVAPSPPVAPPAPIEFLKDEDVILDIDLDYLGSELDRLEKICGSNMLQDIFYEVHDGKNAVTNLSARYPEVRESMGVLYRDYGFDIVYEELDG